MYQKSFLGHDLSFLFVLEVERGSIAHIRPHPTCTEDLGVPVANEQETSFLKKTMDMKCAAFGAKIVFENRVGSRSSEREARRVMSREVRYGRSLIGGLSGIAEPPRNHLNSACNPCGIFFGSYPAP